MCRMDGLEGQPDRSAYDEQEASEPFHSAVRGVCKAPGRPLDLPAF
jgi:hypothetical protein